MPGGLLYLPASLFFGFDDTTGEFSRQRFWLSWAGWAGCINRWAPFFLLKKGVSVRRWYLCVCVCVGYASHAAVCQELPPSSLPWRNGLPVKKTVNSFWNIFLVSFFFRYEAAVLRGLLTFSTRIRQHCERIWHSSNLPGKLPPRCDSTSSSSWLWCFAAWHQSPKVRRKKKAALSIWPFEP